MNEYLYGLLWVASFAFGFWGAKNGLRLWQILIGSLVLDLMGLLVQFLLFGRLS